MKGLHCGKIEFVSNTLQFKLPESDANLFKIPLNTISTSSINKNDIILHLTDSGLPNANALTQQDRLCEVRFFNDTIKQSGPATEDEESNKKLYASYVEILHHKIVEKASIGRSSRESIATIHQLSLAVPRGKYTLDFYDRSLRFHGSTFNHNVSYKEILKAILLPMSQENRTVIILQLQKPIVQGQTVHPFIVIQISREDEIVKTNVKPQYLKQNPHLKDVKSEYSGSLESVVVDLLKAITNIDFVVAGDHFKSQEGRPCVKCNFKAQTGWLYFLKKSLVFIMRPIIYLKIDDINRVFTQRKGIASKQFDIKIFLRSKQISQFLNIDKAEHDTIINYFKEKGVKMVKLEGMKQASSVEQESEGSDEEFKVVEEQSSSYNDSSLIMDVSSSNKKGKKKNNKKK